MADNKRQKESEKPLFDMSDRGFNIRAWYLVNTEESKGDALVEVSRDNKIVRQFIFPAYKVYNLAAHFHDIIDGELSKDKERGYRIASSTGLEGGVIFGL